jgi:hypothetical protein
LAAHDTGSTPPDSFVVTKISWPIAARAVAPGVKLRTTKHPEAEAQIMLSTWVTSALDPARGS